MVRRPLAGSWTALSTHGIWRLLSPWTRGWMSSSSSSPTGTTLSAGRAQRRSRPRVVVLSQAYLGVYPMAHIYGAQVVHSEPKHPPHVKQDLAHGNRRSCLDHHRSSPCWVSWHHEHQPGGETRSHDRSSERGRRAIAHDREAFDDDRTAEPEPDTHPRATAASCCPLSDEGTCYEPGEYCRDSYHRMSGVAGDGEAITCEDNDGWRWEPS
jgi:hypothetical protein